MANKERRSYKDKAYWGAASVELLKKMIAIPSLSKQENKVADLIKDEIEAYGIPILRINNNIIAFNKNFNAKNPSIILNSHHDTVPPNSNYTKNPFEASEVDGKLYGLGSNDAGGSLSSLIHCFIALYEEKLNYNLILIASAEEEISGKNGVELVFNAEEFRNLYVGHSDDFALVGEPTLLQMAVAERNLMVIDAATKGVAGHAARNEGTSALYKAVDDIALIKSFYFEKDSDLLGPVKTTVTVIHTDNKAHNVVPDSCHYVIDCRINEQYTFEEVLNILQNM
ncbi:MAG TPA: M20/M25/M40 family metallo-hydrolase, partial [Saprospiraceae bacterium]|nr:M20/M25/M40 family metallo-hydrolase [Saprospiraceae bacterium]